ncbi:hypothetical protein F52700_2005 [Fusarium sp. NRRL 52700]|nr:hypothetical protein F52700_2005 [Fusarium sp. NRRL 52700]
MNQLPNYAKLGSLLEKRRPVINLSPDFQSLAYNGCEKASMEKSEILPWSEFTFRNIMNAYGDVLEQAVNRGPPEEVPKFDCKNHDDMTEFCFGSFNTPSSVTSAISLGRHTYSSRFSRPDLRLACAKARQMKEILPEKADEWDLGNEDQVYIFYDESGTSFQPFLATAIAVPSCTWKPSSLVTANHENQPELGPIEQLAACAKTTKTCFSFIIGDKDIVVLQFFKAEAGKMGVY